MFRKVRVTAARKLNRGLKRKRWGWGRGEKALSAFARLNLETCYKSTSHTAHKFLKVNEAIFSAIGRAATERVTKSLGVTNQDKKNGSLESLLNLLLHESQKKKHTRKTAS